MPNSGVERSGSMGGVELDLRSLLMERNLLVLRGLAGWPYGSGEGFAALLPGLPLARGDGGLLPWESATDLLRSRVDCFWRKRGSFEGPMAGECLGRVSLEDMAAVDD